MSKIDYHVFLCLMLGTVFPAVIFFYLSGLVARFPSLLFVCGLILVLIGAHGLDLLLSLQQPYEQLKAGSTISSETIAHLKHNRKLWVLIFPFVTAAVGTNLMSQAITYRPSSIPDLEKAISKLRETTTRLEKVSSNLLWVVFGLVIALVIYAATRFSLM